MARQPKRSGALVLRLIVGLALVAAPLLAAPPAPTPHPTMILQVGNTSITTFAYSPDSEALAIGSGSRWSGPPAVNLWDVASGQSRAWLEPGPPNRSGAVPSLAFSSDSRTLATGGWGCCSDCDYCVPGPVQLWDA